MGIRDVPVRFWIAVTIFATSYVSNTIRFNMAVSIRHMANNFEEDNSTYDALSVDGLNNTTNSTTDEFPRQNWTTDIQNLILDSYFWGYVVSSAPSGFIAEWFGPYYTVLYALILSAFFNSLCIRAAPWHFVPLILCRFILGLLSGSIYPSLQCLISRWAPHSEKGRFVSALMGNALGICVCYTLVDVVNTSIDVEWGLHFLSIQIAVFCLIFGLVASDGPSDHKWISDDERKLIKDNTDISVPLGKYVPPYLKILTSVPFWALCVCQFGDLWGLYFQATCMPKIFHGIFGFGFKTSTALAMTPYLFRMIFGIAFGHVCDRVEFKGAWSKDHVRKLFILFSHIVPGIVIMFTILAASSYATTLAVLILSMAFNGAAVATNLRNVHDLSPNFAGPLFGAVNSLGSTAGFLTPLVHSTLTHDNRDHWKWNGVIAGCIYILCGLFFIAFGTSQAQPWNELSGRNSEDAAIFDNGSDEPRVGPSRQVDERSPLNA
ncbi:vesicular glutamate transporter 1-like isoform X2 [Cylas formicarius]|uniref:vesicular glutamate transporter 1-like isoform X2 n=1 Tax=Cylas formicarius TaxID=197179 RepID=UPI0029587F15|nr:vesicular glutamate transporter 1-like isoform X2 [Cylas formicarius]